MYENAHIQTVAMTSLEGESKNHSFQESSLEKGDNLEI